MDEVPKDHHIRIKIVHSECKIRVSSFGHDVVPLALAITVGFSGSKKAYLSMLGRVFYSIYT